MLVFHMLMFVDLERLAENELYSDHQIVACNAGAIHRTLGSSPQRGASGRLEP